MARTREFDRDAALGRAMKLFWAKGYAATSLDELLSAMEIGRQSLYNTFGDKRRLYLEALGAYQRMSIEEHLGRLKTGSSVVTGIEALLFGLISKDPEERALGCLGVSSASEFGVMDVDLADLRTKAAKLLHAGLVARIREGQQNGELDPRINAQDTAAFIGLTMTGLQLAARAGSSPTNLRAMARFAIDRLKAH